MAVVSRLSKRFNQFGGLRLVWSYFRLGLGGVFLKQGILVLCGKKHIDEAYNVIQSILLPKIQNQYKTCLSELVVKYKAAELPHQQNQKIWFCWLQGLDHAPEVVKICYLSLQRNLRDREVVVVSEKNIGDYVSFPDHVQRKYQQGIIPKAHYTDLLRLELLIRYGGTWIDSTVLCTGCDTKETGVSFKYFDDDLFFFQIIKQDKECFQGISNWFISASSNQKLLLILRDMLYQYWRDYNCLIAYYIFHIFFSMIARVMPDEIAGMSRVSNKYCFYLEHRLGDVYDNNWMKQLTNRCCFHKLSVRLWEEAKGKKNTFMLKIKNDYNIYNINRQL